jgi:class 3 adenylate cyclase
MPFPIRTQCAPSAVLPSKQADWDWHLGKFANGWRGAMSAVRKLAAILVADVVGFSRLAGAVVLSLNSCP